MRYRGILIVGSVLLTACATPSDLPPTQVLERTSLAMHDLESVRFDASGTFEGNSPIGAASDLTLSAQGILQREHGQIQATFGATGTAGEKPLSLNADIIIAGKNETYFSITELSSGDPQSLLGSPMLTMLTNQWWRLPSEENMPGTSVTPDPQLLELQSQAVTITQDHGMTTQNGVQTYHYSTQIDREKLKAFLQKTAHERGETFDVAAWEKDFAQTDMAGEVWINAKTFYVERLKWDIVTRREQDPSTLKFDITFDDHDDAPVIRPPQDAKELPSLPDLLPPTLLVPGNDASQGMPPDMQRELMESLLNGQ